MTQFITRQAMPSPRSADYSAVHRRSADNMAALRADKAKRAMDSLTKEQRLAFHSLPLHDQLYVKEHGKWPPSGPKLPKMFEPKGNRIGSPKGKRPIKLETILEALGGKKCSLGVLSHRIIGRGKKSISIACREFVESGHLETELVNGFIYYWGKEDRNA